MNKYLLTLLVFIILYISIKKLENFYIKDNSNPKIAIQTVFILKENLPFLEEWIVYHKKIGIDKFYLYDNTGSKFIENNNGTNKRKINYDKAISLTNEEVNNEMIKLKKKYPEIVHVKWQPRDKNNNITYGQLDAVKHYIKNYGNECDFTAFTDTDEFIYPKNQKSLKDFINNKKVDKLILQQTKMNDRFCGSLKNKNVLSSINTLEIDSQWAPKNIIKNNTINLDKLNIIHDIPIKTNSIYSCNKNELFFYHFNISKFEYNWMKNFLKKEDFKRIDNEELNNFAISNNIKLNTKFINKNEISKNFSNICIL